MRLLFAAAIFLASFLLFLVEPIAAKQLLPFLGGSAAVWITCLVFFQTALLSPTSTRTGSPAVRAGICTIACSLPRWPWPSSGPPAAST